MPAANQIYSIVNSISQQAYGAAALTAVNTQGLIALGNYVLSSSTDTELFLNTLTARIGKTIVRYRLYRNKLSDMVLTDMEWGQVLQKLAVKMPVSEADEQYGLTDGTSVDHYVVAKPQVDQKLFVVETPYQFHITIQRNLLRAAFLSESAMESFISAIFGQVRNKIESTIENMGRLNIAAGIAEAGSSREFALVSGYNSVSGRSLTAASAILDSDFLRYAIRTMKTIMDGMTDLSELYNDGTITTFTPFEDQKIKVLSEFEYALETVVDWAAFNDNYVKLAGYGTLNFWQSAQTPGSVLINAPSTGTQFAVDNVVAVIYDRDALGVYQQDEDILTTPVNAAGAYYNQYYHCKFNRMLDTSENFVYFTLN